MLGNHSTKYVLNISVEQPHLSPKQANYQRYLFSKLKIEQTTIAFSPSQATLSTQTQPLFFHTKNRAIRSPPGPAAMTMRPPFLCTYRQANNLQFRGKPSSIDTPCYQIASQVYCWSQQGEPPILPCRNSSCQCCNALKLQPPRYVVDLSQPPSRCTF